jgi:hypothetical protein
MDNSTGQQPGWAFREEGQTSDRHPHEETVTAQHQASVSWTASEFVAHQKDASWYAMLFAAVLILCGLVYVFTKDLISVVTIFVVGVLFATLANKKPRELPYTIDNQGIIIGSKLYPYAIFKSFAVHQEGIIGCINLLPLKRLMPELSVYYPPESEAEILGILADYLPHEQRKEQSVDRLMKRIRF